MPTSLLTFFAPSLLIYSKTTVQEPLAQCFFFFSFIMVFTLSALIQDKWNQIIDGSYLVVLGMLGLHGVASNQWSLLAWFSYSLNNLAIGSLCLLNLNDNNGKFFRVLLLLVISLFQKNLLTQVTYSHILNKVVGQNLLLAIQIITYSLLLYEFQWLFLPFIRLLVSFLREILSFLGLPIFFQTDFFIVLYIKVIAFVVSIYGIHGRFSMWHLFGQVFANVVVQDLLVKRRKALLIEQMNELVLQQKKNLRQTCKVMEKELKSTWMMLTDELDLVQQDYESKKQTMNQLERIQMTQRLELHKKTLKERYKQLSQKWKQECQLTKQKIKDLQNEVKMLKQRS